MIDVPYNLGAALEIEKRYENMLRSINRGLPRLQDVPIDDSKTIHIACYGPSLKDTWKEIKHPIISVSGATKFLAERGIISDYHVDIDPRPHKIKQIMPPVPGVKYLLASVCDPEYFELLKDEQVILWHAVSSTQEKDLNWLYIHDRGQLLISAGSHVGLSAIQIGGILGYRRFEIHGMDCSFAEGKRHAGEHFGKVQDSDIVWPAGGKTYYTSRVMANGAAEAVNSCIIYPIFCIFHGDGLVQALIKEENLPNSCLISETEKVEKIRNSKINFLDIPLKNKSSIKTWSAWEGICYIDPNPKWLEELQENYQKAELTRKYAKFNTGSISLETGMLLKSICEWKKPEIIIEIGTFIGKSTLAMNANHIYTCDKDNDCLQSTEKIHTRPHTTSTDMLYELVRKEIKADMFFFDGRIQDQDIPLIKLLSNEGAIYAFDDYEKDQKGEININKLLPHLNNYVLLEPYPAFSGRTTLALLIPATGEKS